MESTLYILQADPAMTVYQLARILEAGGYCLDKTMYDKLPEEVKAYFVPSDEESK